MRMKRIACVAVGVVAAATTLAGCGGNSAGGQGVSGTSASVADIQALAQKKVDEYKSLPTKWPGGTSAFKPGTGKVAVMVCGMAVPICAQSGNNAVTALKTMGWQASPPFDGAFSPQAESGFIDRAVQDHVDGVVLISVNVNTIKASVDRALAAKIPITCVVCASGSEYQGKVHDIGPNYTDQGVIGAWAFLAKLGGKTKAATFEDKQFVPPQLAADGMKKTIEDNCSSCSIDVIPFAGNDASKPGPPEWSAYLASHPEVNAFAAEYDSLALTVAKTNVGSGRKDILVGSHSGADEANLNAMISGSDPISYTVAYGWDYFTWTAADVLGRIKAGVEVPANLDQMPNQLIENDNAAALLKGNPPGNTSPAPAGDWQAKFKHMWGVS